MMFNLLSVKGYLRQSIYSAVTSETHVADPARLAPLLQFLHQEKDAVY